MTFHIDALLYNLLAYVSQFQQTSYTSCGFGSLDFLRQISESLRDENCPRPENRTERKEAGLLGPTKR